MTRLVFIIAIMCFSQSVLAFPVDMIERRKDQKQTTPGYIFTPAAANIPGIGFTYGILGSFFNVNESETDLFGFQFFGDLTGKGVGVTDLFVIPAYAELLTLNLFWNSFEKIGVEQNRRGIKSSRADRSLIELDQYDAAIAQLNLRFFERRWQINASVNTQTSRLSAVRDKEGELVTRGNGEAQKSVNRAYGTIVDLTDDRSDPRQGLQAEAYRYDRPRPPESEPYFYTMDYSLLYFVPIGRISTWAFNIYRSDAVMIDEGDTNSADIREKLGFNCQNAPNKAECENVRESFVEEQVATNRYGTATPIGGTQRLRSYVTNRYYAAHSLFAGTEFRWNLTEEFTPFNIIVAGGVRTGIQTAFFIEGGTVSDRESELTKNWKYSYGAGVRAILASGFVVRFDLATGSEGTQPVLVFQYPWMVF